MIEGRRRIRRRAEAWGLAGLVVVGIAAAGDFNFPLKSGRLDGRLQGMPLLEGSLSFTEKAPNRIGRLPENLSNLEYAELGLSSESRLIGLRGTNPDGIQRIYLDRDTDGDFFGEKPVDLRPDGLQKTAVVPIAYFDGTGARRRRMQTDIVLIERKPGKIEYHFDLRWEAVLSVGAEQLKIAFQRWPIMFLDIQDAGSYDKIFFLNKETLALGGKFFRVEVDFSEDRVSLKETDRVPVDEGFAAPDFEAPIWNSGDVFKLSAQRGKTTVLTFWSPHCPGSKAEAALYSRLADESAGNSSVNFIAVISDESDLMNYLKEHSHAFRHVVSSELWTRYGVTAPFVTFVIDNQGKIAKRFFRFSPKIGELVRTVISRSNL